MSSVCDSISEYERSAYIPKNVCEAMKNFVNACADVRISEDPSGLIGNTCRTFEAALRRRKEIYG